MFRKSYLLLIIIFLTGCSSLLTIGEWRIVPPKEDKLRSPGVLAENARKQKIMAVKFDLWQDANKSVHKNTAKESGKEPQDKVSSRLSIFANLPELNENRNFTTIFEKKPPNDTYSSASPLSFILERLLDFYQQIISPGLNTNCPYCRSCSRYARKAVQEFGPFLGFIMAIDRLLRCNRTAGDKYFITFRKDKEGKTIYPLKPCLIDEPAHNNIFNPKPRTKSGN